MQVYAVMKIYLGWLNPHSDEQFRALERKLDGLPDFPDLVR
jgi:hypothetical protein